MRKEMKSDKARFVMLLALERNLMCCTFRLPEGLSLSNNQAIQPFGLTFTFSEATTSAIAKKNEEHNQIHK
jgi:hypothetical protein